MKSKSRIEADLGSSITPQVEQLENRLLLSLVGVNIEYPQVTYDNVGTLAYMATAETFDSQAVPTAFRLSSSTAPVVVKAPRNFQLHFLVDNAGNVVGGVAGPDLLIEGQIDINRDNIIDYDGVLLTAEICQFGFLDSGGPTDQYDFRLIPTGGDLLPYFAGQDVGLRMTSPNSTFTGSFTVDFHGEAHGVLGPIDTFAAGLLTGRVFSDANNNGSDDAETGIPGVGVSLTGTDYRGTAVSRTLATTGDGSYLFNNLLPGSYALSEAQPAGYLDGDETAGNLGGLVSDDVISQITVAAGQSGSGYAFGEISPASLSGSVSGGTAGIPGVTVTLTGTDDRGVSVSQSAVTGLDGSYLFADLRPGTYALSETQPSGYLDGDETAGNLGGLVADDVISEIAVGPGQSGQGYTFGELAPAALTGQVYLDLDNDGQIDPGETGIADTTVTLTGTDDRGVAVALSTVTNGSGAYSFGALRPGTYSIAEAQPEDYIDGQDAVGNLGGLAGNDITSGIALGGGQQGAGYNFGEMVSSSLSGFVWVDFNDDGEIDFNEKAVEGVVVNLMGQDDRGNAVNMTAYSDIDGIYEFLGLRPGTYVIAETQPTGLQDGAEKLGSLGGVVGNDTFSGISLGMGVDGINYNFGERTQVGATVTSGQTATIGFWQNRNGQNLLKALNGGQNATQLGSWLAATFPNLYAGLVGKTNAQIAAYYQSMFSAKKTVAGPAKVDCQVMATAFAVYVTNSSLAGNAAAVYGFRVTQYGVGIATWNVGSCGSAFGVSNNTTVGVLDLLLATDARSSGGNLYNMDALLRALANEVYTRINEAGDIG
jgi:protocatechuate 3,4-dioxygenase beta subunit